MILIKNYLDKEFCKGIINYCESQELKEGLVGNEGDGILDEEVRISDLFFLSWPIYNSQFIHDLYFNMEKIVHQVNRDVYGLDVTHFEPLQFTKYKNQGKYDWHIDVMETGKPFQRKLSFSLLLNESEDFEGGDLEFRAPFEDKLVNAGDLIIFPSFEEHRVTPVTEGIRYSLVGWMHGPRIR